MKTAYIAQAFAYEVKNNKKQKKLLSEQPLEFKTAEQAIARAQRIAGSKDGAVAIAQQDADTGEVGDFRVLFKAGVMPQGLRDEYKA